MPLKSQKEYDMKRNGIAIKPPRKTIKTKKTKVVKIEENMNK